MPMRQSSKKPVATLRYPACDYCHGVQAPRVRLDQDEGPSILTMCLPCLRSATLKKAALNEQRGVRLLRDDAEENGLHLWRSAHAVYLLPTIEISVSAAEPQLSTR